MDFVGQFTQQNSEAERQRKIAEAMRAMGLQQSSPTMGDNQGFEYMSPEGGTMSAPGQQYMNWADPLAKLGIGFMARGAEQDAAKSEQAASQAKLAAIQDIMSKFASGQMSPQDIVSMGELGVDPSMLKLMMPKTPNTGAITQGYSSRAGLEALKALGIIDQAKFDAGIKALGEDDKAKRELKVYEQSLKPGPVPRGLTMAEFARSDPEGYAKMKQMEAAAALSGKPIAQSPYQKKLGEEQAKVDVKTIEGESKIDAGIARANELLKEGSGAGPIMGPTMRVADALTQMMPGQPTASNISSRVQIEEQKAKQFHLDAMEQMRGFGQVTEAEQAIIAGTQFDRYDSPEARAAKVQVIKGALERGKAKVEAARARAMSGNPLPVAPGGDNVDDLLMKYGR
jgi:hypothetical protein